MSHNGVAPNSNSVNNENNEIDENLYSRQLFVVGRDAMKRMKNAKVLISGMKGLGLEIAKNTILAGVKEVVIHDENPAEIADLGTQYYIRQNELGKNRAEITRPRLAELNNYVPVSTYTGSLSNQFLAQFNVVVLTESSFEEKQRIGEFCHKEDIKLVIAETKGLFGMVFCDFGEKFEVFDSNGEQCLTAMIANISQGQEGIVTTLDERRHGFEDGDWVEFKEVSGMDEINGKQFQITVLGPYSFKIGDTSKFSMYSGRGLVSQIKKSSLINFKSFSEAYNNPEFLISDFAKFDHPAVLHVAFKVLCEYEQRKGRLPRPRNLDDANEFFALIKTINESLPDNIRLDTLNESLIKEFAYQATGSILPVISVMGGIASQEILKSVSGKFTPINQWLYFDSIESLPEDKSNLTEAVCKPLNCRYDSQIAVFGSNFQKVLGDSHCFIVGAGAIGCEHLKNFAMMGVGCGSNGLVTVTDMDAIETSNLNRQFLFRPKDVKSEKSATAARAAKEFNKDLKIVSKFEKVGPETEHVFDDNFFDGLTFVANALDNIQARDYMDRRCIYYLKPLLESGTLGTKGNTQVVLPHITESYSSSQDPPEPAIPICTLRNFPYQITHTLQWAREQFESLFSLPFISSAELAKVSKDKEQLSEFFNRLRKMPGTQGKEILLQVRKTLQSQPRTLLDCVLWARDLWLEWFHNDIAQMLFTFPADQRTSSGGLFWSPPKRCPHPLIFSLDEQYHIEFITSAALLRSENFNILSADDIIKMKLHYSDTLNNVRSLLKQLPTPAIFKPREGVRIAENDSELESMTDDGEVDSIVNEINQMLDGVSNLNIKEIDFEKDDDLNFHMEFIVSASNNRAENFEIEQADKLKSKGIAGKVIPAIATTTALVSGLVGLELYKILHGIKNVEMYKNGFVNLALPFFAFSEPICAPKMKYSDQEFTLWDRFELNSKEVSTIFDLINFFQKAHNLEVQMVSYGVSMLYSQFMNLAKKKKRETQTIQAVIEELTKKPIPSHSKYIVIEVCCADKDDNDVDVPYIKYQL